jgi:quercetin dioxygenase-like cupin family protein
MARRSLTALALAAGVCCLGAAVVAAEPALHRRVADPSLAWGPCPAFMPQGCELAVLHGDPAQPNADVFFRVPARAEIPNHWHSSAERMVLVEGVMRVAYNGQAPVTLHPGSYAYGPAKAPHSAVCLSASPCVLFIAFEGPIDAHPSR